jgi:predicted CXXCH cytochrome family protein
MAFLLLSLAASVLFAVATRAPHLSVSECATCHLGGTEVNAAQAKKLVAAQEQLCVKCHQSAVKMSHPSGFAPQRALPAEYPLDWKGDLTCSTCHESHGSTAGLLRGTKRGKSFCLDCHEASFFSQMKDAGTSVVSSGHMPLRPATIDVDAHSLHCLGCHTTGSYAGGGTVNVGKNGIVRHASGAAAHPIGRVYRDVSRNGDYHPESQLAQKKILLSDGKISCISCHEVYKKEHGKLVITMDRSALCFGCHDK